MESDTRYLLRRASEEATRAISAEKPQVADVHVSLSARYSARALILLVEQDEAPGSAD